MEIARLLSSCSGAHALRNKTLVSLALGTGMRIGELVALRVGQVAGKKGSPLTNITLEKHSTKNGKSRRCYLSKQAQHQLGEYLATFEHLDPDSSLFPSQKGGRAMSPNSGVRLVDGLFRAAGIENATSHSLRKTHANTLRRSGADMLIIQQQLGHSSLAITQRYLATTPIEMEKAVAALRF